MAIHSQSRPPSVSLPSLPSPSSPTMPPPPSTAPHRPSHAHSSSASLPAPLHHLTTTAMSAADGANYPPEADTPTYRAHTAFGSDAPPTLRGRVDAVVSRGISYLPIAVQRYLRSRSTRSILLLLLIPSLLIFLLPSPTHTGSYLPSFSLHRSSSSSTPILYSSSPYTHPSHTSTTGSSLAHSEAWGLQGIEGSKMTLDERLQRLLDRPYLNHPEMEVLNRHECPFYTYSRNSYFFHDGKSSEWESLNSGDVARYRSSLITYLKEREEAGDDLVFQQRGRVKRGIIVTGGDGSTLKRLQIQLNMLRNVLNCKLPIEVYHFPDEMTDPKWREEFTKEYDVSLKVLDGKTANGKNWHIKNQAFIASEFTEFLYLDSDNIPLSNPEALFDSAEYREGGSVFWPDLYKDHPDNSIWRVLGRVCSDQHWPAEAGQLLFDKRGNAGLNLAVLHIANHMMQRPEMYGFMSYGDKDTFRFSFYALSLPYQQAPKIFATLGGHQTQGGENSTSFCGHSLLQWGLTPWNKRHDPSYHPPPAFMHTILAKHRYNLQPSKLFSHYSRPVLDGISEPLLVRTEYAFTGDCFSLTQKGPDGRDGKDNSMGDGQAVITETVEDLLGKGTKVMEAMKELAEVFVAINQQH